MISMTGYGQSTVAGKGMTITVELRTVNSRYFEVFTKLPKDLQSREHEVKEVLRNKISRAKITLGISVEYENKGKKLKINSDALKSYYTAFEEVRKIAKIKEPVSLSDLLRYGTDILAAEDATDDEAWLVYEKALNAAADNLNQMRKKEGYELGKDIAKRIREIEQVIEKVANISKDLLPAERERLRQRIALLFENDEIDEQRLQLEIVLLADKIDITEEVVRYRSHSKFFIETMGSPEPAGRKLNFLLQEMNREITTIGSKCNNAEIAQLVVKMKEEIEKIREQMQNIE